jgi:hypothetical protein
MRGRGRAPAVRGQARANSGPPWEGSGKLRPSGAMGSGEPPPSSGHGRCGRASRRAAAMGDAGEQAGRASREARASEQAQVAAMVFAATLPVVRRHLLP